MGHTNMSCTRATSDRVGRWLRYPVLVALATMFGLTCFAPAPALALPENRVYEMVSPVYKGGYGVSTINAVAPDGESVAFGSFGAFSGAPGFTLGSGYVAHREAARWMTASVVPPMTIAATFGARDFSSTLESSITLTKRGPSSSTAGSLATESVFLLHQTGAPDTEAGFQVAGEVLETLEKEPFTASYRGASADFSHILVEPGPPLLTAARGTQGEIYDLVTSGEGAPQLRLVGLNNKGNAINPYCGLNLGPGHSGGGGEFNAVSAGGREVFFTTNVELKEGDHCGGARENEANPANPEQLFVRLGGSRTLEVSKPLEECSEVPCEQAAKRAQAEFHGASENGSKVFFTTSAQLVGEDKDTKNDLYMAQIGCPSGEGEACMPAETGATTVTSLVQISHSRVAGEAAEVQGVVRVAPDGSRVYFVARGVLNEGANAEGNAPVKGADNLYVYDSGSHELAFIADLCSGPQLSGEEEDLRCPPNLIAGTLLGSDTQLWLGNGEYGQAGEAQTAGVDGRFLVFSSYAQLAADDTDNAKDVYRYDAATGMLDRISLGEAGYDANGNRNDGGVESISADATIGFAHQGGSVVSQYGMNSRAVSEDGSRIVFATADPLSPGATPGLVSVYVWHEEPDSVQGTVSLLSSGSSPATNAVISPSGRDIFFVTSQELVPQDTDGAPDVYDAHECTAQAPCFPPAPAEGEHCKGDACYGPLTNPAPLLVPGSVPQAPDENLPPPKKTTPKKLTRAQQLARALKACAKKPKSKRAACRRSARKKYAKAVKSAGRSRR
jgi:hypothetical protein